MATIPSCAVELLFVEDLIDRIMRRHTGLAQFKAWRAEPYRDFILNAFSDDIARAVDFIDSTLEWEMDETFSRMVDEQRVSKESFVNYALHFEELCFRQGFDPDHFLDFCVRLVSLAAYFAQYGRPVALELALIFIMKVMTTYDLFEGGWDTLNAVARKYVERREDFCRVLTPDASDDESMMMNILDDEDDDDEYLGNNEEGSFASDQEETPKDELDRQRLDFSGLVDSSTASIEKEADEFTTDEDDVLASTQKEMPQDEPYRDRMGLPGPDLVLPAASTHVTEGYTTNGSNESIIAQDEKPLDKEVFQRTNSSGLKSDISATFENEANVNTSSYESFTIQTEKAKE